jgi:hypothetical protein
MQLSYLQELRTKQTLVVLAFFRTTEQDFAVIAK